MKKQVSALLTQQGKYSHLRETRMKFNCRNSNDEVNIRAEVQHRRTPQHYHTLQYRNQPRKATALIQDL